MDITETLNERGKRYGLFLLHSYITQELKQVIQENTPAFRIVDGKQMPFLEADQKEALEMICHKIGRIINGDPNYANSWHDIAGYAQLVADRLNQDEDNE